MKADVQHLVVLRCNFDDFPVLLTPDRGKALRRARGLRRAPKYVQRMLTWDHTGPVASEVWSFENGKLASVERVRDFTA